MNSNELVGIGNALLDFQIEVSEKTLRELGVKKASMTLVETNYQLKTLTKLREQLGYESFQTSSGGSAVNTLAGFKNFGGNCFFIGKLGDDENGKNYASDLKSSGIEFQGQLTPEANTGTCLALITPDAERSMLTCLGVSIELSKKDLVPEAIQNAKAIFMEGYLWDSPTAKEASLEAVKMAKANGVKVAFTLSDSHCVQRHHQEFLDFLKNNVDYLFCNQAEAMELARAQNKEEAFEQLSPQCESVFISTGPEGALASAKHGGERISVPTWDCRLVDKLGAGDLFASGALFGLLREKGLKEAAHLGCYAATRVIQQTSARLSTEQLAPFIEQAAQGPRSQEIAV